jgi:MFS family permease
MIIGYFKDFGVLRETRKEYWGIQLINFLDCTAYFALLTIASVFLSDDLGLSDRAAGYSITAFTSAVSILLFFSGMATDWLGIRRSLDFSLGGQLVLRLAMVWVGLTPSLPHRGLLASVIFFLMAPFIAGLQTVFQSATNRYTTRKSRGAGFNLWYLFMNIGAAAAGFSIDIVQLVDPGEPPEERAKDAKVVRKNPLREWRDMARQPQLWRLLVLVSLIVGVRAVYVYVYLLMPKYWIRTIGPDAAFGTLNAINPIGIVIGITLFIPFANRFPVFKMLVYGAMISSVSLLPLALPWTVYGLSIGNAHYLMALLCMVVLTVGEVAWSPKLYEYAAVIAPKGQEGAYLGLALFPWFLAKTLVSAISGHLLERWCPETVVINGSPVPLQQAMIAHQLDYWHRPEAMWLILGGYALASCLIAASLGKWLTQGAVENRPAA